MVNSVPESGARREVWRACLDALLVLLFVYASLSKLLAYDDFRTQMRNQVFAMAFNLALFYILPPLELAAAVLLIVPRWNRVGRYLSLVLLVCFTGYVALVMLHVWHRVPCSCGGVLGKLKWGPHLALNIFFLAITLISIYLEQKERRVGDH